MARQLRIEYPGAMYHVISRGSHKNIIFHNDHDKTTFLKKTKDAIIKYSLRIHSFALMNNHFHFLMETPLGNLSKGMHLINTSYANWFKAKHHKTGKVFHKRYGAILVEKNVNMLNVSTYIHLNPVRAKIVRSPGSYKWSSFSCYMSGLNLFPWIYTNDILNMFSGDRKAYQSFFYNKVESKEGIAKKEIVGKYSILGGEKFRENIAQMIRTQNQAEDFRERPDLKHIQRQSIFDSDIKNLILLTFNIDEQRLLERKRPNNYRKIYLFGLKKYSNLSLKEIGSITGMDYSAVSKSVCRFIQETKTNSEMKMMLDKFEKKISSLKS